MASREPILQVKNMSKNFGPTQALKSVNIDLYPGEVLGLIGENGSGKSTVSSIVAGIQPTTSGEMIFNGKAYQPKDTLDAQKQGIGMIVQEMGTVPDISVAENIFLGEVEKFRKVGLVNKKQLILAADQALKEIGVTFIDPAQNISKLNLEDRKLVEVAKVMKDAPQVLIVDESTTALSQQGRNLLYALIHKMTDAGKAIIFISHDIDELIEQCDRLTVLRDGNLIGSLAKEQFDVNVIKKMMVGRSMDDNYYRKDDDGFDNSTPVLEARNIHTDTLRDISLTLHKGEILGIGGLSQCGMHELGKIMFGDSKLEAGSVVHVATGNKVTSPKTAMKLNIGYVSKDRDKEALILDASISDNIALGGLDRIRMMKCFISPRKRRLYVNKQIKDLQIKCQSAQQYVQFLSGGNKQKVVFGKWVGRGSEILILDCPTRGVDIGVKASMYQLIYAMKQQGKAILIISEELPELIGMSDRLLIMKNGRIAGEFLRSEHMRETDLINYMV